MTAYYNEFDPFAAAWLKALIDKGLIARGDVDDRSIRDVQPDDLRGYSQCHFFAGIGGWSLAFHLAGLPDDFAAWSGSCPCQPFSSAGKQKGVEDERHLWPEFFRLIRERRPSKIFGEQVADAIKYRWFDGVACDLESQNYAVAAAVLPACAVGSPQRRNRIWFVANATGAEFRQEPPTRNERGNCELDSAMARTAGGGRGRWRGSSEASQDGPEASEHGGWCGETIECDDGKRRLVKPGLSLLAHGIPNRLDAIRGFGNAIVPQVAAEFITAALECAP